MYSINSNPKANKQNVIVWGEYRVTVLADRLFRVEKSKTLDKKGNAIFNDQATQGVLFRNMPKNPFTYSDRGGMLEVKTSAVTFILPKDYLHSCVVINGRKEYIYNNGNLKGTNRTLDGYNGEYCIYKGQEGNRIVLTDGVCSTNGVAVLDDSSSFVLEEDGSFERSPCSLDIYVFAYGRDYVGAVKAFYMIEGSIPMVPRYVFGNWWSRYYDYTDKTYLSVLNKFEDEQVPLSVATIDMDWHYSDNVDKQKNISQSRKNTSEYVGNSGSALGWTGYSWNEEFFPDPEEFLSNVKAKNLAITLNIHPADGVRWWEDCYKTFAKNMGVKGDKQIPFDLTDDKFVENYFKLLHHPNEDMGVDFWWIDWQQGTKTAIAGLDPLWLLNHYHYLDNQQRHGRGLILSRFSGAGAHRYPLGFSGDTSITWDTLDYLPKFTATSSNIGYTLWSHDIGGHHFGERDEELYVRSLQYGVFSPIMRLHSTKNMSIAKEPWAYPNGGGEIAKYLMRLRHQLVPYIYSEVVENCVNNTPWIQPLYYHYPNTDECYKYFNQYFFGSQLMVCPITQKGSQELNGWGSVEGYIPKGIWTDIFTGEKYKEGVLTLTRSLQNIPVLIKEGGVLTLAKANNNNGVGIPRYLIVKSFKGNGEFTLNENADATSGITFTNKFENGEQVLTIEGFGSAIVDDRTLRVEFPNIESEGITFLVDDSKKRVVEYNTDYPAIIIENFKMNKVYEIVIKVKQLKPLDYLKKMAIKYIPLVNGSNGCKYDIVNQINGLETVKDFARLIKDNQELETMSPFKTKMREIMQFFVVKD